MADNIFTKFIVFPTQQEFSRTLPLVTTFKDIRNIFVTEQPKELNGVQSVDQMRFIHSGQLITDNKTLADIHKNCKDKSQVTLHMVINKTTAVPQPVVLNNSPLNNDINNINNSSANNNNNNTSTETQQAQMELEEWARSIHFHGCFFNEAEANQVQIVFEKKKGNDGLMEFTDVHMFLRSYWKWMTINRHRAESELFPMDHMMKVKKQVIQSRRRLSLAEFRQIFFLFDNNSSEELCPHGNKERVKIATEKLHQSIDPNGSFIIDKFESLFRHLDKDSDETLSCRELELFYYLYTLEICQTTQ